MHFISYNGKEDVRFKLARNIFFAIKLYEEKQHQRFN